MRNCFARMIQRNPRGILERNGFRFRVALQASLSGRHRVGLAAKPIELGVGPTCSVLTIAAEHYRKEVLRIEIVGVPTPEEESEFLAGRSLDQHGGLDEPHLNVDAEVLTEHRNDELG